MSPIFGLLFLVLATSKCENQHLHEYFKEHNLEGGICLYDTKKQTWLHSDSQYSKKGTLPASTFKILHTLIALEEAVVKNKEHLFRWDRTPKLFKSARIPSWNQDQDLESAFKNSTIWCYEEIAKSIKTKRYCKYLKSANYSNRKIKHPNGNDFWNYGKLRVSLIDQIKLLIHLYNNKLPFKIEHQELTKDLMIEEENEQYLLRTKTGWSYDGRDIGWYVGYIELADNVIFFSTRIEKDLDKEVRQFSEFRKSITKKIISDLYNLNIE